MLSANCGHVSAAKTRLSAYSITISYLVRSPLRPRRENFVFLSTFDSGSMVKFDAVEKSASFKTVPLNIAFIRSLSENTDLVKSLSVKSTFLNDEFLNKVLCIFFLRNTE